MNTKRVISIALALVLVFSLAACTRTINVNVNYSGAQPVAQNNVASQPAASDTNASSADTSNASQPASTDASKPADNSAGADTSASDNASSGELSSTSPKEDIVAEYIKVYNTTKATGTFTGKDSMTCDSVTIDGSENGTVKNLADKFMTANGTNLQLPPYSDTDEGKECKTTAADIDKAEYTDNGDGTATIKLFPASVTNSRKFSDAQGNMFNVMEDVASALANISVLKWSEGDANSNVVLTSGGGYCEVTYDKASKMMTKAEYVLITTADVKHANILFLKDKSAVAQFTYVMSFPG